MEKINYQKIVSDHPWIIKRNQNAIISPDTDGILSGLFMSLRFDWKIVGFYDGKLLKIKPGLRPSDCIFLDMEILRSNIRSIGHHMNIHNLNSKPDNYEKLMTNCINPNYLRGFDRSHNFSRKYPLGTIHLLMAIADSVDPSNSYLDKDGFGAIFFADGIWKILFKYTENVMDWFEFLNIDNNSNWWQKLQNLSVIDLIKEINTLISDLSNIHPVNKRWFGHIDISDFDRQRELFNKFLGLISKKTGWKIISRNWQLEKFNTKSFTKKINDNCSNNLSFNRIWDENPISLAMTEGRTVQYTIDGPNSLN